MAIDSIRSATRPVVLATIAATFSMAAVACAADAQKDPPVEPYDVHAVPREGAGGTQGGSSAAAAPSGSPALSPAAPAGVPASSASSTGAPPLAKRVFVTSGRFTGDLVSAARARGAPLEPVDANTPPETVAATTKASGDFICNLHASAADLKGDWTAFLSGTKADGTVERAIDRIPGNGPWKRLDGAVAFATRAALVVGAAVPISITESGQALTDAATSGVWTGTNVDGTTAVAITACGFWTYGSHAAFIDIVSGAAANALKAGPDYLFDGLVHCDVQNRLYCFEK